MLLPNCQLTMAWFVEGPKRDVIFEPVHMGSEQVGRSATLAWRTSRSYAVQEEAWDVAREERGIEGMTRAQSNPHQDEIDAVGSFFEVEQQLAALQANATPLDVSAR